MLTVREAKSKGIIPKEYVPFISDICDEKLDGGCGSELEVSENLTTLRCSNPRCNIKVASRCASMLESLGVAGIGFKFCKLFIDSTGYGSHLTIFMATQKTLETTGRYSDAIKLYKVLEQIKSRKYTFPSLVSYLALPGLDERAKIIFHDCMSIHDFDLICEYLGVTPKEYIMSIPGFGDILSEQIAETIETFRVELEALPAIFKLKPESLIQCNIAVTGSIKNLKLSVNRNDFRRYLNTISKGYINFTVGKSLSSCEYIVADEPSASGTYEAGVSRQLAENDRYDKDLELLSRGVINSIKPRRNILVTSNELEAIVLEKVKEIEGRESNCQSLNKLINL